MSNDDIKHSKIGRRDFIKLVAGGVAATTVTSCVGGQSKNTSKQGEVPTDKMTMRENSHGEKVAILGYGCMRLPTIAKDGGDEIDQETVNRLTDYAIEHGVTYFDTSPAYCKGRSEHAMGIALSRHDRSEYTIATKLSNFAESQWSREASLKMYKNSFRELKVDYIDYLLLHGIGMGGMAALNGRYMDNGMLDFLLNERKEGRIRNLGFSYHGDIEAFDYLLSKHDEYKWDFVQIQLNYVDWKHAKQVNPRNTNAEYLYSELEKRGIPAVIMEPLLGGRLASLNGKSESMLKRLDPEASIASWAFRYAGSKPGVMTVLSGMTYMEHLQENIRTYSPLIPVTDAELTVLEDAAMAILDFPLVQCNTCQYCMPCPYGLDIPGIFNHYNKCLNDGNVPNGLRDENYAKLRKIFLVGYDRSVPKLRQADHCTSCNQCMSHCPQRINIPAEMKRINDFVEALKQQKDS